MASHIVLLAFEALAAVAIPLLLFAYITGTDPIHGIVAEKLGVKSGGVVGVCLAAIVYQVVKWLVVRCLTTRDKDSVYGLQHGRLHLQMPTAMWMNMGYWKGASPSITLAEACRDLLKAVLAEAGFSNEMERTEAEKGTRRTRCLFDFGFGCGDQTVYLMSSAPVRLSDEKWWDGRSQCIKFDHYVGITKDVTQARYASERVEELVSHGGQTQEKSNIALFCTDAAQPALWNEQLHASIKRAQKQTHEHWVLALDTAYHFKPSRWPLINHVHSHLDASFMGFDLCLSPTATSLQKVMLRALTTLMGAPWANFVTPQEYREKLIGAGYRRDMITITDISDHVFMPLATFLGDQDKRLKTLELGIGSFNVAKIMFGWWGRTGVVRGVIVVAKKGNREGQE